MLNNNNLKTKTLKNIFLVIGTITAILILLTITLILNGNIEAGRDESGQFKVIIKDNSPKIMDSYDQTIQATLSTYPTDIFVYGEDCKFRNDVKFTQIAELSEASLQSDKKYKVIIFNDLYDKMDLTEEDLKLLKAYVLEGDYAFFYTGNKHMATFIEEGFTEEPAKDDIGFALRHSGKTIISSHGLWDKTSLEYFQSNNPELLGESIFTFIGRVIREG